MKLRESIPLFLAHVEAHNEEATLEAYTQRLNKFAAFVGRRGVKRTLVNEWIQHLRNDEQLSKRTVVHYRRTLCTLYGWLVENEFESKNPVSKPLSLPVTHAPKVPFTDEELSRLLAQAAGHEFWEYGIMFGNETGLRLSDVALMRWGNSNQLGIDFTRKAVRWMPKKTKRYEKFVEIPLGEPCLAMLERMKLAAGTSEFVAPWMAKQFQADAHRTLSMQFIRLAAKAHVYDKSFHNLRATFVTRCLQANISPAMVASFTGHSLSEIMTYATFSLETKRAAMGLAVNS